MISITTSYGIHENLVFPIKIETEITEGIGIHLVGIPDKNVKELLLRSMTALQSLGYKIPGKKININISSKQPIEDYTNLDLPVMLTILQASEQEKLLRLGNSLVTGQIGLDGSIKRPENLIPPKDILKELSLKYMIDWLSTKGSFREAVSLLSGPTLSDTTVYVLSQNWTCDGESGHTIIGVFLNIEDAKEKMQEKIWDFKTHTWFANKCDEIEEGELYWETWEDGNYLDYHQCYEITEQKLFVNPIQLNVLFGLDAIRSYDENYSLPNGELEETIKKDSGDCFAFSSYSFNTPEERNAYLQGLKDNSGWGDYIITEKKLKF